MVLVLLTQALGASSEIFLIAFFLRRRLLSRGELAVVLAALLIEILRMLLVDVFVLDQYFFNEPYWVFRAPAPCLCPRPPGAVKRP